MTKQKEPKMWHVTYHLSKFMSETYAEQIIDAIRPCEDLPYLWVGEGQGDNFHHHAVFWSKQCKNTLRSKIINIIKDQCYFSDPNNAKYKKYDKDGIKGVEIYINKGPPNHMKPEDNLDAKPAIVKTTYSVAKLEFIRKKYEETIQAMRKYKEEVKNQREEKEKHEWGEILKDLKDQPFMSPEQIVDYLTYQHFMKPEIKFSEVKAKNLYLKLIREKNEHEYMKIVKNSLNDIRIKYLV